MEWETVIGLEVHVQLKTESKMFCSCSASFGDPPNTNICPVCTGQPGVLPVPNQLAIELAVKTAMVLKCRLNKLSRFARKNYFYPDLPKNYQISQYDEPLGEKGFLDLPSGGKVGVTRVHQEEDTGKLLHYIGSRRVDGSLVDFNRSGVPLLEIVSEPEISSPRAAAEYLEALKQVLQYTGVSDCDMEKGSLRCDANLSLRPAGRRTLGVKTEIKNMNSFKSVEKALSYEASRQKKILDRGEKVLQETRLWDEKEEVTKPMRSKEYAHDYRYFPEPDLVPIVMEQAWMDKIRSSIVEMPLEKKKRFLDTYKLSDYDTEVLTSTKILADFYEKSVENRHWTCAGLKNADYFLDDAHLVEKIIAGKPDAIAATLYLWNVERALDVLRRVRGIFPKVKIIAGGPEVARKHPFLYSSGLIDVAVCGEGEVVLPPVLKAIRRKQTTDFSSVAWRHGKKYVWGRDKPDEAHLATCLPGPDYPHYRPDANGMAYLETTRGCPWRCVYCRYGQDRRKISCLEVEDVLSRVKALHRKGAREIRFIDPSFNAGLFFNEIIRRLAAWNRSGKVRFFAELNGGSLTGEQVKYLKDAGFEELEIGVQSRSPEVLRRVRRPGDTGRIGRAIGMLLARKIKVTLDLMYPLPGEGRAGIINAVKWARKIKSARIQCLQTLLLP